MILRAMLLGRNMINRISVFDKRIINGKTDVNQLVPFKYQTGGALNWE